MKKSKLLLILSIFILGLSGCSQKVEYEAVDEKSILEYEFEGDYIKQPVNARSGYKEYKDDVKAIFMTGNTLGYKPRFEKLM